MPTLLILNAEDVDVAFKVYMYLVYVPTIMYHSTS